jgi:RNA polymerase sigma factor (sigma-70 family)
MAVSEAGHAAALALDDLYRAHAGEIYRYALAVLGNRADAEDVTQTTFLNAYRSLETGVRPRKPSNWLLTIASNVIKQRFRAQRSRPRGAVLDDRVARDVAEETTPTIGELLAALRRIPPLQREAIVLREFEGRSYAEIAEILDVTTPALESLLFRARRSLSEELESRLTCSDAQLAVSRAVDGRLGRKERRRLRGHLEECPDCARFVRAQQRNRRALRGLALVPIPVLEWPFKVFEQPAAAAFGAPAATAGIAAAGTGAGVFGGSVAVKAAAVVTAATVAGGLGVAGGGQVERKEPREAAVPAAQVVDRPGERMGQVAPRGVTVPGRGVALGKTGLADAVGKQRGDRGGRTAKPKPATERPVRDARPKPVESRAAQAKAKPRAKAEPPRSNRTTPTPSSRPATRRDPGAEAPRTPRAAEARRSTHLRPGSSRGARSSRAR